MALIIRHHEGRGNNGPLDEGLVAKWDHGLP
jgi:hypothetical protein